MKTHSCHALHFIYKVKGEIKDKFLIFVFLFGSYFNYKKRIVDIESPPRRTKQQKQPDKTTKPESGGPSG